MILCTETFHSKHPPHPKNLCCLYVDVPQQTQGYVWLGSVLTYPSLRLLAPSNVDFVTTAIKFEEGNRMYNWLEVSIHYMSSVILFCLIIKQYFIYFVALGCSFIHICKLWQHFLHLHKIYVFAKICQCHMTPMYNYVWKLSRKW